MQNPNHRFASLKRIGGTKVDQLNNHDALYPSIQAPNSSSLPPDSRVPPSRLPPDSRVEADVKESIVARKVQKADREKLRRDRLNEHFMELGNTLDPDRPKNDKASILSDTIQMLKDLSAEVNRLKSEYSALTEESRELTQEKSDLREEKASLKSDIESLNGQYQQRVRSMYPWMGMDHSVVVHPPSYPFPMPMPIATGPMPMHPSMQPYPFVPSQCSTFVPYITPSTLVEQQSVQHVSPVLQSGGTSNVSSKQDSGKKSSDQGEARHEKSEDSDDVATELELKTPGSASEQDLSPGQRKGKKLLKNKNSSADGSSPSGCSSSHSVQAVSSNSVVGGTTSTDD